MIQSLRRKLTSLFLALFILLYLIGGAASLLVFYSGLSKALDEEIMDLSSEIKPAIQTKGTVANLTDWANAARHEHLTFPAGIQLFDGKGNLLESYGTGGKNLQRGEFKIRTGSGKSLTVRSNYEELNLDGKLYGYLQIQMSTDARDDAVKHFGLAILLILPFLTVFVSLAGYFFSGLAIKPVEKSISVLQTFVADAGHEFITPVTVVEASLQTLEEIMNEKGMDLSVLNIMKRASQSMKELAEDLLYLAKIDNPATEMPKEYISVNEIVGPAIEELLEIARSKEITLTCTKLPNLLVKGNLHALKIMVSNLISNAIKYTNKDGTITVSVTQEGQRVCISVEDTGVGIPADCLEHIFDRFYRVDKSRSRSAGGSGLGLAIVKAILEMHEGNIEAESTQGKGSKFTAKLPLVPDRRSA